MTQRGALARAGLVVTSAFFFSRVLGWVRLVVIGNAFGATGELDAFFAAFRIPDLIFQLVAAGALSSALIPIVAGLLETGQDQRAWRVASTVTNLMMGALLVLAVLVAVAAPVLIPAITPGFDIVQTDRTIELTRIMLLSPVLLALGSVATSLLNAENKFGAASVAPLVYNVAIIFAAAFLAPQLGVEGLALGVVVGSLLHIAVQLPSMFRGGFRYEPEIHVADPEARQALVLMAPRAVGLGVSQLTFVVSTTLASGLATGSITAFNIAFTILQIPIGVIGVPLGVVVFPSMARQLAAGSIEAFTSLLTRSVRLLLYVMLPITGLAMVLRRPIVTLLFDYGKFDERAIELTASTLLYFLVGLAAHSLIAVLARAFYAARDTRTPVAAAILAVVVNVTLGVLTVGSLGLAGLALAIAIGAWAETAVLVVILRRRQPTLDIGGVVRAFVEAAAAALAASLVALGTLHVLDGMVGPSPGKIVLAAESTITVAAGGLAYLAASLALRIPELPTIVEVMLELVRRPRRPPSMP